eukprot:7580389-Pyramimonas_sp.AAC.1
MRGWGNEQRHTQQLGGPRGFLRSALDTPPWRAERAIGGARADLRVVVFMSLIVPPMGGARADLR